MDGPLILTQLTVVENVFNIKQKPERLHFKVGDLKSGNQASTQALASKLGQIIKVNYHAN